MDYIGNKKTLFRRLSQWAPLVLSVGASAAAAVDVARHVSAVEAFIVRIGSSDRCSASHFKRFSGPLRSPPSR